MLKKRPMFSCLLMGVKGKGLEIVSKYKLSEVNYKVACADSVSHYENKRHLVSTHMSELLNAKPMKGDSAASLDKLKRDIDNPVESLKSRSRLVEHWDNFIVYLTTSRFYEETLKDWQRLGDSLGQPTEEQLNKFIKAHLIYLEASKCSFKEVKTSTLEAKLRLPRQKRK